MKVGESIYLEAIIDTESNVSYSWYKNGNILSNDSKRSLNYKINKPSLTIDRAEIEDTGIYCIIAKTEYGVASSFANVQVFDNWNINNNFKDHCADKDATSNGEEVVLIQDHLPEEIEANENEDIRLICVAKIDYDTKIEWFKDKKVLKNNSIPENYGHNYIGLKIRRPTKNDTGVYSVALSDKNGKVDSSSCFVTVNGKLKTSKYSIKF